MDASSDQPHTRRNRGPHPKDAESFSNLKIPDIQSATQELSWLLSRSYPIDAALKLVGDRYRLLERQRMAVKRSACSVDQRTGRRAKLLGMKDLGGQTVQLDGLNILVTLESALSRAILLRGQDGVIRDLGSVHGTYRHVRQTDAAIELLHSWYLSANVGVLEIFLDQPVSNSGRLAVKLRCFAEKKSAHWSVQTVRNPDQVLIDSQKIVATADSWILDNCQFWTSLVSDVIDRKIPNALMIDLSQPLAC